MKGLPFNQGICYSALSLTDFSNYVDPATHKNSPFFKCNILLEYLLGAADTQWKATQGSNYSLQNDVSGKPKVSPSSPSAAAAAGATADAATAAAAAAAVAIETQLMFKLCTIFMVNLPVSGMVGKRSAADNGVGLEGAFWPSLQDVHAELPTQFFSYCLAVEILTSIEVVRAPEDGKLTCQLNLPLPTLPPQLYFPTPSPTATSSPPFEWNASQAQCAFLINYCILIGGIVKSNSRGVSLLESRGQLDPNVKEKAVYFLTNVKCWTVSGPKKDKWKWTPGNCEGGGDILKRGAALLGVEPAMARSRIETPNDDLLILFDYIFMFIMLELRTRRQSGGDGESTKIMLQTGIFLARIMKYMGDKSHVIGALVYNFISGKSFCITTIDRPLVSTIMNLIFCGNLGLAVLRGDNAAAAPGVTAAGGAVVAVIQAEGGAAPPAAAEDAAMDDEDAAMAAAEDAAMAEEEGDEEVEAVQLLLGRIFDSLKNLGLAISPFDMASAILNKLPGFYGRYLHGIARGGKTLWIYGPSANSDELLATQKQQDISKMIEYAINVGNDAAADPTAAHVMQAVAGELGAINGSTFSKFAEDFRQICETWKNKLSQAKDADKESLLQQWTNNKWEEEAWVSGGAEWKQIKLINKRMLQAKEAVRVVEWFKKILALEVPASQWPKDYEEKCADLLAAPSASVRSGYGRRAAAAPPTSPAEEKAAALLKTVQLQFNMLNYFLTPQLEETFPCERNKNLQHVHPNNSTVPATVVIMFRSLLNLLQAQLADTERAPAEAAMIEHIIPATTIPKYIDLADQILISCGFDVKMCIINKERAFINATLPDKQIAIWQIMNSCAAARAGAPLYETVDDMVTMGHKKANKKDAAAYKIAFTSYVDSVTELAGILKKISLLGAA